MEAMNIDNLDEGNSYLLGELDEHELRGEESEHEVEDEESEHEVEDEESEHEVEGEESEHEVEGEGSEHEVEGEGSEHEVEDESNEHEVEGEGSEHEMEDESNEHEVLAWEDESNEHEVGAWDEGSEHEVEDEGSEHEVEDEGSEHEVEDDGSEHEVEDERSEHEVEDEGSEHEVEDEGSEHEVEDDGSEHEVEDDGSEHEVEDDGSEHEVEDDGSEHDNSGSNDDLSVHEKDQPTLHFIDCIVQEEQKCDANVVLSCFEAAFHVLRSRFSHVKKIIIQSDNAKNLAGKQSKLLLPHVCSAAGFKLVAYYHNEAQSGKDVCDTHFSHQQTQVEAYLTQGEGGHKISTPKQLAVALMEKSTINTIVLLIKPNFKAPYRSAVCPSIKGISEFYVAQYITNNTSNQQNILLYNCLGQTIPSARVHLPSCHASSLITPMGEDGINFTGVTVLLNSDNDVACTKIRMEKKRYTKRTKCTSKRELQKMEQQREHEEALRQIKALYPQCSDCHYHFKSQKLLDKHICDGTQQCLDASVLL